MASAIVIDLAGGFIEPLDGAEAVLERAGPSGAHWPAAARHHLELAQSSLPVVNLLELGRTHGGEIIVEAVGAQTVIEGGGPLLRVAANVATVDKLARSLAGDVDLVAPGPVAAVTGPDGLVITGIGDRTNGTDLVAAGFVDLAFSLVTAILDREGVVAVVGRSACLPCCAALIATLREAPVIHVDAVTAHAASVAPLEQRRSVRTRFEDWERLRSRLMS